jgi:hypothetical protein
MFLGQNNKFVFVPVRQKIAKNKYLLVTKMSLNQNTKIYSIMYSLLHVSVTINHQQTDISVYGHDVFSASENTLFKTLNIEQFINLNV